MSKYPNKGSLFPLDAKYRTSDKSPSLTGSIELGEDIINYIKKKYQSGEDVVLDLSAWSNVSPKSGKKFLSLAVKEQYVKGGEASRGSSKKEVEEDDIPF